MFLSGCSPLEARRETDASGRKRGPWPSASAYRLCARALVAWLKQRKRQICVINSTLFDTLCDLAPYYCRFSTIRRKKSGRLGWYESYARIVTPGNVIFLPFIEGNAESRRCDYYCRTNECLENGILYLTAIFVFFKPFTDVLFLLISSNSNPDLTQEWKTRTHCERSSYCRQVICLLTENRFRSVTIRHVGKIFLVGFILYEFNCNNYLNRTRRIRVPLDFFNMAHSTNRRWTGHQLRSQDVTIYYVNPSARLFQLAVEAVVSPSRSLHGLRTNLIFGRV